MLRGIFSGFLQRGFCNVTIFARTYVRLQWPLT